MKKIFILLFMIGLLAACGGNDSSSKKEPAATTEDDLSKNPDYQKGLEVEAKYNCKTCHAVDVKVTGPAYREIADKYASYPDTIVSHLANKVISGGMGVWGEIPMVAHPEISKSDAEAIVKYVL